MFSARGFQRAKYGGKDEEGGPPEERVERGDEQTWLTDREKRVLRMIGGEPKE